jgi:hypothetical protein
MNRKAQTKGVLSILLGGLIGITIFSLLFIYILRGADASYPTIEYNESEAETFAQTQTVVNLTEEMNAQFTSLNSSGTNVGDIINVVTTGGYNTLRIFGATPAVYNSMIMSAAAKFGVPVVIANMAVMFIIAGLIGLFILLVFRVAVI